MKHRLDYINRAAGELAAVMDKLRADGWANEFVVMHAPTVLVAARLEELADAVADTKDPEVRS